MVFFIIIKTSRGVFDKRTGFSEKVWEFLKKNPGFLIKGRGFLCDVTSGVR